MPIGPNGEKRPISSFQASIIVAKIATGDLTEETAKEVIKARKGAPGGT